jgi:hypothetical protein
MKKTKILVATVALTLGAASSSYAREYHFLVSEGGRAVAPGQIKIEMIRSMGIFSAPFGPIKGKKYRPVVVTKETFERTNRLCLSSGKCSKARMVGKLKVFDAF